MTAAMKKYRTSGVRSGVFLRLPIEIAAAKGYNYNAKLGYVVYLCNRVRQAYIGYSKKDPEVH